MAGAGGPVNAVSSGPNRTSLGRGIIIVMVDSRMPLTIRPVRGGFAIVFADGGQQHIFVEGDDVLAAEREGALASEEALDLTKEIARALVAAWGDPMRSAA